MRKLILQMQSSIDGFVDSKKDDNWQLWSWGKDCPWDKQLRADFNKTFKSVDTVLLSRPMADQGYIQHWTRIGEITQDDPYFDFSRKITRIKKIVATRKKFKINSANVDVLTGDLAKSIKTLKKLPGKDIIAFGGVRFARNLLEAQVVDEIQLYINPSIIGEGEKIFDKSAFQKFGLLKAKAYRCGIVVISYALD